jgi:hypothetical protein
MSSLLFVLLSACSPVPTASAEAVAAASAAPANWFYADPGGAVDWASVRFEGADVVFRTAGRGLVTGPAVGASWLACGHATRATLLFEGGTLADIRTVPESPCVEAAARALAFDGLPIGEGRLADTDRALVVYDVPAEATCSSCS